MTEVCAYLLLCISTCTHMMKHLSLLVHTTPRHQQPLQGQKVMQLYED